MPGSKKDRKHGKDGGGVVAALTKHGAKFSSESTPKDASPNPSPVVSPAMNPSSVSSSDNPVASPLLDAISSTSYASNSPSTREWARGLVAGMAGSPGNLISLVGESPPTAPSSYEDTRGMRSGWSSPRPVGGYHPPSASPPTAGRRPLSFHMDGHYSPPDAHLQLASAAARRSSMHSHFAQVRTASNPPLPHQPQPHFYGAPALDVDLKSQTGMKAGEKGYYFGFDTLSPQSNDRTPGKDNVVVAGYQGGLDVFSVGKRGLEKVASLKGLRGGVYQAKILPWTSDTSDLFPLVAVVIHGPVIPPPGPEVSVEGDYDAVSADRSEAMTSASPDPAGRHGGHRTAAGLIDSYQTTVEVLSLKTGQPVSVLLEAPKVPLKSSITSSSFRAPPPTGAFHIHADGGNVVVSSGITGECWIYRQTPATHEQPLQFRCHGKLWTTLQQPPKGETPQESERGRPAVLPPRSRPQVAIVSLSGRWIAYCPAAPSSQIALRASVPVPALGRAPGLATVTPPQLPPANADVDLPLSESVMNKIMRDATQELIQGAKWVGKQGWQAWNNYWNPQSSQQSGSPTLGPSSWGGAGSAQAEPAQFPPTHGTVAQPVMKEPGMVSVLDIESLGSSVNPHPVTTFAIPHGCSFLSFSPSGLSLFSASSKGDVQTVWDLMRIQHTRSSPLQTTGTPSGGGPRVRQIAQFSRMTVARIVDVAWARPNGERLAMVTERGTVHLLDMPSIAFTWPPPRRRRAQEVKSAAPEGPASAVSMASNALSSVRDVARPLINRQRRSNSNAAPSGGGGIGEYAAHGGKVIAAGISHSLGKTGNAINQLRHTGENRVSLPSSTILPGPSCAVWVTGKKDHSLFVLGGGAVRTFPAKSRRTASGADKRAPRLSRYSDFRVPLLPDDVLSPLVKSIVDPDDEFLDFTERDLDGGTSTMVLHQPRLRPPHDHSAESSIPQAEIESSAPYQPFHTDRRVALYEMLPFQRREEAEADLAALMAATSLEETALPVEHTPRSSKKKAARHASSATSSSPSPSPATKPSSATAAASSSAWVFGQPIPATKLDLGLLPSNSHLLEQDNDDDHDPSNQASAVPLDASRALPASAMERILQRTHGGGGGEGDEDGAQIVVTTRRRRGAAAAALARDEDGFFEDDCEVLDFADQRV